MHVLIEIMSPSISATGLILDALIAETAIGLGATLATFNTKHYKVIAALSVIEPYNRGG